MGFLSDLFSRKKDANDEAAKRAQARWEAHEMAKAREALGHIHLEGPRTANVYVYDGKPMYGIRKGDTLTLDAIPGNVTLVSKLNGSTWSSCYGEGTALGYNGSPVGFTNGACEAIEALLNKGYKVSVAARCNGMYAVGIHDLEVMLPTRKDVEAILAEATGE